MDTDCSSGSPVDSAWREMYPAYPVYLSASKYPVTAGDMMSAVVVYAGSDEYTMRLFDDTKGWEFYTQNAISASRVSAEVIVEAPTGYYPDFGSLSFIDAHINNQPLSAYSPSALDPSSLYGHITQAHASALTASNNSDSFTMTYLHE